ncbi:hypothetical protein NDU88_002471 [Pleurodeles waltl]|uniref:Uncharacterized protein n=1 Tax=Pleurodeles waltl TaxID=8319 RepID=A0AAV7SAK2_PLEWA|nr:hypothetical protein NDU88_002471 [Pleurodeles waltl]
MANQYANKPEEYKPAVNNVTTIAQVGGELDWSPVQAEQTEPANLPELSSAPCGTPKVLPIIQGRSSLTDQELGALSEQFLNNLEEHINRILCLTTKVTATTAAKHAEKDEAGGGPSVGTTPECSTNAQELAAIGASQDIMARALLCQSNKMELQLDLFQSLATYLLEIRTKVINMENLLATTMMGVQCPCSPILEKLCILPNILRDNQSSQDDTKHRQSYYNHLASPKGSPCLNSPHSRPKYRYSKSEFKKLTMSSSGG